MTQWYELEQELSTAAAAALGLPGFARPRQPDSPQSSESGIARPGERYWTLREVVEPSAEVSESPEPEAKAP